MRHFNTTAIIDIILRLLTTIENNEMRSKVNRWLKNIDMVKHITNLFYSKYCSLYHSNASQLLCDIIRVSREQIFYAHEQVIDNNEMQTNDSFKETGKNTSDIIKSLYSSSLLEEIES
jgi:serine/threonine-protein phosphatase 6 regulatory subunit 1